MPKKKFYRIGIDIGGTKILVALINDKNKVISSAKARTISEEGEEYLINTLVDLSKRVLDEAAVPAASLAGIGIGCPGIVNAHENCIIASPNMSFLNGYPLGSKLEKIFSVKVSVENDVNMGLYGEYQFGAAAGYSHIAGFFLGTGIGGALILDGKLYRGSTGAAGELGHIFLDPLGPVCGCGRRGCLEAIVGRLAISSEAAAIAARGQAKSLFAKCGTDVKSIKSGSLAKSIKAGDKSIKELVRLKSHLLGIAMGSVVNVINPEIIVLGGGMVEALPSIIVPEAEKSMREHAMPGMVEHVKVVPALLGDFAITLGAAQMVMDKK